MKTNYFPLLLILVWLHAGAQEVRWAGGINPPAKVKGLVCDLTGNVYTYGSNLPNAGFHEYGMSGDNTGSFLYKMSGSGTMLMEKRWKYSFHIQNMVHDGHGYFYFAGTFFGNFSIDGRQFLSNGGADGCVGKMDENGTLLWLSTFGGPGNDACNGISMNVAKNRIIVTGGVSGNLLVNGILVAPGTQYTMLIAAFDLSGGLLHHRQYNFMEERNEGNIGNEITGAGKGQYLLLGQQEGKFWTDDSVDAPPYGHYVYRLDSMFNINWSRYIINGGCYYGYSVAGLSANGHGDAYIPDFCSGKYGGSGKLRRLSAVTGEEKWTLMNEDGAYKDTYCTDQNMYVVGTEGANGCPCEDHDIGYQVVKSYDAYNGLRWTLRLHDVWLTHITKHEDGRVFVAGTFPHESAEVGGHTVTIDKKDDYPNRGTFLAALDDLPIELARRSKNNFFRLYPNPSDGAIHLKIELDSNIGPVEIRIFDMLGQELSYHVFEVMSPSFQTTIVPDGKLKGIYFVEFISRDVRKVKQILLR